MTEEGLLFREEQRFRQWWVLLSVAVPVVAVWWLFVRQVLAGQPVGDRPLPDVAVWVLWAVIGLGLPALLSVLRLVTEVRPGVLVLRFRPLAKRIVPLEDLADSEVTDFRPIVHYGGWGLRWGFRKGWAWTVSGNRGVRLTLEDGRLLLVGSQQPENLDVALQIARG